MTQSVSKASFLIWGNEAGEHEADSSPAPGTSSQRCHRVPGRGSPGGQTQRLGTERRQGLCSASLGLSFPICKSGSCSYFFFYKIPVFSVSH